MATLIKARERTVNGRKVRGTGWTVRSHVNGKQREKTFKTQKEALQYKTSIEHAAMTFTYQDPKKAQETFLAAGERYCASVRNRNSREAYVTTLRRHLTALHNRTLASVANDRQGIKDLCASNPAASKRMLTVIRNVCQEAVNSGAITAHRLQGLKPAVTPGKREFIPHTAAQLDAIADGMGSDGLAVKVMQLTGMRLGEVLAVERADFVQGIDGNWTVKVSRQVQKGEIVPLKHRHDFTGRTVPVPASLASLVMARPDGRLFNLANTSFRQKFVRHAVKAGLPSNFTPHQLRHGYASTLAGGIALTDVARWLGDEIRTVATVYAHLMPGQADRALSVLESGYALKAA